MFDTTDGERHATSISGETYAATLFSPDEEGPSFPYVRVALELLRQVKQSRKMDPFLKSDYSMTAYILVSAGDRYKSALDDAGTYANWDRFSRGYWEGNGQAMRAAESVRQGFAQTFSVTGTLFPANPYANLQLMLSAARTGFSMIREEGGRDVTGTTLLFLAAFNYSRIRQTSEPETASEVERLFNQCARESGLNLTRAKKIYESVLFVAKAVFERVMLDEAAADYFIPAEDAD